MLLLVTCTISHVHGRAPKTVLRARNLVHKKLWFIKACHVTTTSKFITQFVSRNLMSSLPKLNFLNYNKRSLFDFLITLAYLYWKWLAIITSKSITHFSEKKTVFFISRHPSQCTIILLTLSLWYHIETSPFIQTGFYMISASVMKELSRYYIARGGTTMHYAKKVVIFIVVHIFFHKEYLIR